jgi:hypothetical protein
MQFRSCCALGLLVLVAPSALFAAGTTALAPDGNLIPTNAGFNSTAFPSGFNGGEAVDNLISTSNGAVDNGLIFQGSEAFDGGSGPNQQRAAFDGFNSAITEITLYSIVSDTLRVPASVTIRSSTTAKTSLNAGDYETALVTNFPLGLGAFSNPPVVVDPVNNPPYPTEGYAIIPVNAPAGTQSLYFDFDANTSSGGNGARIQEVQAFLTPEPASMGAILLGGALFGMRRRAARAGN